MHNFQSPRRRWFRSTACVVAPLLVVLAASACSDTATQPGAGDLANQLWALRVDKRGITMSTVAPYDTITLTATAYNGLDEPLADAPPVHYTPVTDTTMRISDAGVLRVRSRTSATKIAASMTYRGVTKTDTITVVVTTNATPPQMIDTVILSSVTGSGSSAIVVPPVWSTNPGQPNPTLRATAMSNGQSVSGVPFGYVSSNPTIATVNAANGTVTPYLLGHAAVTATTTWYGVTKRSHLQLTVVGPMIASFVVAPVIPRGTTTPVPLFEPANLTVETGAVIAWHNFMQQPVDIIFDDSTDVAQAPSWYLQQLTIVCLFFQHGCNIGQSGGNIHGIPVILDNGDPNSQIDATDVRYFPVAGTYNFHTQDGVSGTLVVQ